MIKNPKNVVKIKKMYFLQIKVLFMWKLFHQLFYTINAFFAFKYLIVKKIWHKTGPREFQH